MSLTADGADDGARLLVVLVFIVGDLEGVEERAEVAILDSLLLFILLRVVLFVDLNLLTVAAACVDDDIRSNGLATDLE